MKSPLVISAFTLFLSLFSNMTFAAPQDQQPVYGSQLMTQQEMAEHRAKMRAAKTQQERNQIRNEQHERMQQRAKERGVTLPNQPPQNRPHNGMGPGNGMGNGTGPRNGMGPGQGMGPGDGTGNRNEE